MLNYNENTAIILRSDHTVRIHIMNLRVFRSGEKTHAQNER